MEKKSWFRSAWKMVGSLWSGIGALVSILSTAAAVYQIGVDEWGWRGIPFGFDAEPWHFSLVGYAALFVTAVSAYHKLSLRTDALEERLNASWRNERKEFDKRYLESGHELSRLLETLKLCVLSDGYASEMWDYWLGQEPTPQPPVNGDFCDAALGFWINAEGGAHFSGGEDLEMFKDRFRTVLGFFTEAYNLLNEYPDHAATYLDEEVRPSQYAPLHVLWYFAHMQAHWTYGEQKPHKYAHPPKWHRLWREWNPGCEIPINPETFLTPSAPGMSRD